MTQLLRFIGCMLLAAAVPILVGQVANEHKDAGNESAWDDFGRSMKVMHVRMSSISPSGDDDTDFVRLMLPHHQAALDMARTELLSGKDPQMRRLAQEIITDQQSEIQLMQLWLNSHPTRSRK